MICGLYTAVLWLLYSLLDYNTALTLLITGLPGSRENAGNDRENAENTGKQQQQHSECREMTMDRLLSLQ